MTLLDAKPPKPPRGIRKYLSVPAIIILTLVAALVVSLVGYRLWNIRQERAVSRFLTALEQGKYREAYQLWQPSKSYTYEDFLHDWGEKGDYGKITKFEIEGSNSQGATVIVTVRINDQPPLDLIVETKTLGLAYSIM